MTQHTDQIASVLKRAVQTVLARGLHDPRVQGLISVTRVRVSPDVARAEIGVSVLPADRAELTMHGLKHARSRIQREVSRLTRIRRMPRLEFRLDQTLKRQAAIFADIREGLERDAEAGAARPAGGDSSS